MNTQFVEGESSSTSFHFSYKVFLSFRGKDTRKNFTGHLYSRLSQLGIHTFIDDEELRKGDAISTKLEKAIEQSRVSIIVFSKNYGSSSWCLDELVKILECREKLKQVVLPVFYDVDPCQVRKQSGCFGEALAKHEERFGAERMEKWKAALAEAANLCGLDLQNDANGHEPKFIESIIKQVVQEVNQIPLDVAHHPIGLDSRVEDILWLLQSECEHEVRMVGICGVGGIGKTTLAKAIYNRIFGQFGNSCFLSDVRSKVEALSLEKVQEKLLQQILKSKDLEVDSVDEGANLIKERLGSKKVLIVLDDVDHMRQLNYLTRERSWFGSGSVIIITTRDERLLRELTASERYQAKLLSDNEAQQLFFCHAFNNVSPPQEYVELAQEVINYSAGLPLALVTLGSHLQGRSIEEWRNEFKKLSAIPHCDIQKILKISYDGLDDNTQSVFLDIACAFHGFSKDEVTKTLDAYDFYWESAIATLVQRHLLQRDSEFLVMHDLVRDMGREIVRVESPGNPGKRSRLFKPEEVRNVLQGNKGSENVEILVVGRWALEGVNLSTKAFQKMINLRVLIIESELHICGDFELLSKELRWLSWKECPLKCIPSNFPAEKLVVLDMQGSNIQEFGLNLQYCRSLKKLDLSDCKRLRRTPNFNGSRSLETLRLSFCSSLKEIHQSIGNLDRLTGLYLFGCTKITDLPSSICQLKFLQSFNISCCFSLQTLPVDIGDMQSLRYFSAFNAGIKKFTGSLEMLRDLKKFEVGGTHVEPNRSFSGRRVQIQSLSCSIAHLRLSYCNLSEADIPRDVWSLSSLIYLDLRGNSFRCLHLDFSKLRSLRELFLGDNENLHTLELISISKSLSTLEIANCKKLVDINLPLQGKINMLNCTSLQNPFNEGSFSAAALSFRPTALSFRTHLWNPFIEGAFSATAISLLLPEFEIYLQSAEIPDWCSNQVTASSICFAMPTVHYKEYQFLGMILWCVRKVVTVERFRGLHFGVVGKEHSTYTWNFIYTIPDGQHAEQSCVLYTSCLSMPFDEQIMEGRKKIQITEFGEVSTVKKIGIHLLYVDQHGKVTSLPALVDHSHSQMMNKNQENKQNNLSGQEPQKSFKSKRDNRKQEEKVIAVVNSTRNAKRKLRIAEKPKARKKRKMMAMKMGRWM